MQYLDYIENTTHGTPDFPVAFYHVDEAHPRYEMPFHWHREMEIIYIEKGSFTFYLNDEVQKAKEGDIIFINQGVIHGGTPNDCVYDCVVFDPRPLLMQTGVCRGYIRALTGKNVQIQTFFPAGTKPLGDITDRLVASAQKKTPGSELTTLGALFEWFGVIYETHSYMEKEKDAVPDSEKIQVLKPVLEYIDQSYMQPISLEDLAKLAGMSSRYFCRFFHAFIHRTPIEYLNYYRIERACCLLAASPVSITDAAYQCGFNDSSYFVKIFKKYKGITPKQYQKQYVS